MDTLRHERVHGGTSHGFAQPGCGWFRRWSAGAAALSLVFVGVTGLALASDAPRDPPELKEWQDHSYPAAFCVFMAAEFGPMWTHTMQEEIIFRWFGFWCEQNGYDKTGG